MTQFQLMKFLMLTMLITISSHANSLKISKIKYGNSYEGRDLTSKIIHLKNIKPNKAVILTEGTHGNEYIGFVGGIEKHITNSKLSKGFENYLKSGGSLILIPKVNVDGVHHGTRKNVSGYDLNRKFRKDNHQFDEASQLISFLKEFMAEREIKPLFAVDYHCCGGKALRPTVKSNTDFYDYLQDSMQFHLGKEYKVISTKELFGKTFKGTLKDFMNKNFEIPAITFEASSLFNNSIPKQVKLWDNLLMYFSSEKGKALAYQQISIDKDLNTNKNNTYKKLLSE